MDFFDSPIYTYGILPVLIVFARIIDQSIGTVKIILISRGHKNIAPFLGFFEVMIWLLAVTKIFENLNNWACYFAYCSGFALGSYVGMKIEEKLAIGVELIRIITKKDASELIDELVEKGYGVTSIKAMGSKGEVGIIYSVMNRRNLADFISTMQKFNPNAFYTIEDIRFVSQKVLSSLQSKKQKSFLLRK